MTSPPIVYTALGPILEDHDIFEEPYSVLMNVTYGRACLLLEINDFVLKNHLGFDDATLSKVSKAKFTASHAVKPQELVPHVGKYFVWGPTDRKWNYYGVHTENVIDSRPKHVQWITYVASGNPVSASALANAAENVFRESEHVKFGRERGYDFHSFADRCAAIGLSEIVSPVSLDESDEDKRVGRCPEGMKPRQQIDSLKSKMSLPHNTVVPWTFVGLLQSEARIRLSLATVAKSWRSNVSAWRAWGAFLDTVEPYSCHFPARETSLSAFAGVFDSCDSLAKYVQHIRKAHTILCLDFVNCDIVKCLLKGSAKFYVRHDKSFMTWEPTSNIVEELLERGDKELARFLAVAYQFQMRVQSELIPLQADYRREVPDHDDWHSFVRLVQVAKGERPAAEIVLRVRKNKDVATAIRRTCQCEDTPWLCGVCALHVQVKQARDEGRDRVFPAVNPSDISVIRRVAVDVSYEGRVTWHGFRRGRTSDLLTCDWQEKPTVRDVFVSGGWSLGSRAVMKYLSADAIDPHKVVVRVAASSDSEKE